MRKPLPKPLSLRDLLPEALRMPVQGPPDERPPPDPNDPIEVLKGDWCELIGPLLAKSTKPLKILRAASRTTLWIGTASPVWAHELEFVKESLIEKIAHRLSQLKGAVPRITEIRCQIVTASSRQI